MAKEHPGYDIVNGSEDLTQGDFIKECPIVVPPPEISDEIDFEIMKNDVGVMSQSCDLVQRKLNLVLLCPVWQVNLRREAISSKVEKEKRC